MAAADPAAHFRPTVFVCDEYQNFATVGETGTGDQNFFSLSRQPKCIALVATQSVVSLKGAISSDDADEDAPPDLPHEGLPQHGRRRHRGLREQALRQGGPPAGELQRLRDEPDAKVSFLDGRTAGTRSSVSTSKSYQVRQLERFPARAFYGLKNAQAIVIAFDGVNPIPPCYAYLKPYWLPVEQSWWDQYEQGLLG